MENTVTKTLLANKKLAQVLTSDNKTINLNITNAVNRAKMQWTNEKRATDSLQLTAYQTTLKLFELRLTLMKNTQPHSEEAFKIFSVRQVLNFSGSNFTSCEYYQAFKKKLDIVNHFFRKNIERIKACEPTAEAIERLTLSIFKNYTSLNQAYKESQKEKQAKKELKKQQEQNQPIAIPESESLIATPEIFEKLNKQAQDITALFKLACEVDEKQALESIKDLFNAINESNESYTFNLKLVA